MQLDTEDGETFVPPAGVVASPTNDQSDATEQHNDSQALPDAESRPEAESEE
jgi:sorting nexin-1/2